MQKIIYKTKIERVRYRDMAGEMTEYVRTVIDDGIIEVSKRTDNKAGCLKFLSDELEDGKFVVFKEK